MLSGGEPEQELEFPGGEEASVSPLRGEACCAGQSVFPVQEVFYSVLYLVRCKVHLTLFQLLPPHLPAQQQTSPTPACSHTGC